MLEPIMAKAIAAEIRNTTPTVDAIGGLLEAAAEGSQPIHDIYPRATAAALQGVAAQLNELSERLLDNAGLA